MECNKEEVLIIHDSNYKELFLITCDKFDEFIKNKRAKLANGLNRIESKDIDVIITNKNNIIGIEFSVCDRSYESVKYFTHKKIINKF